MVSKEDSIMNLAYIIILITSFTFISCSDNVTSSTDVSSSSNLDSTTTTTETYTWLTSQTWYRIEYENGILDTITVQIPDSTSDIGTVTWESNEDTLSHYLNYTQWLPIGHNTNVHFPVTELTQFILISEDQILWKYQYTRIYDNTQENYYDATFSNNYMYYKTTDLAFQEITDKLKVLDTLPKEIQSEWYQTRYMLVDSIMYNIKITESKILKDDSLILDFSDGFIIKQLLDNSIEIYSELSSDIVSIEFDSNYYKINIKFISENENDSYDLNGLNNKYPILDNEHTCSYPEAIKGSWYREITSDSLTQLDTLILSEYINKVNAVCNSTANTFYSFEEYKEGGISYNCSEDGVSVLGVFYFPTLSNYSKEMNYEVNGDSLTITLSGNICDDEVKTVYFR